MPYNGIYLPEKQDLYKLSRSGFSKTVRGDSERKIQNYQVTHIFGRTKNPFLFSAPWSIAGG
jgi:hypothetical protein